MSHLRKSKRYDLIDLFNDTSRSLDSQLITLILRNIFPIYIQHNFSCTKQIVQTKKLLSLIIKKFIRYR